MTTLVAPVDSWIPLLDRAEAEGRDLSSLRTPLAVSFVTKLDAALRERFTAVTGSPGVLREAAFGMTETHTMDTFTGGLASRDLAGAADLLRAAGAGHRHRDRRPGDR